MTKLGFLGKDPEVFKEKARAALHMLVNEVWFTLYLEPKHFIREFLSHVRSVMLYGAELLTVEARAPFMAIDQKMTNLFLVKLLKLGRNKLARKHQLRLQLAFGLPTLTMDIEKNIHNCINAWIEKRTSQHRQVAHRANDSLQDITKLEAEHPLRKALSQHSPRAGREPSYRMTDWYKLEEHSRGAQPNPVNRQLKIARSTSLKSKTSLIE